MALRADDIDLNRDRLLVEAWQAGDASAFDELYRLYFDRLRSFCQRRVHDHAEADDIAQEAFLKALKALPRLSGERRFYPWMTVIASRLCIDHHRRRNRVEPRDDLDLGSVDDGHDARYNLQADLDHLDRALRRLGPRHAEVLDLRERESLTYDQIAERLGVPHSTVEALLFRARRALRREFAAVSMERLVAVPVLGGLLLRAGRLRDRIGAHGPDFSAIGGSIAAGALTAVLVALPSAPAPDVVTESPRIHAAAAAGPAPSVMRPEVPAPASGRSGARPAENPEPVRRSPLRPMTPDEAHEEAARMPVHLDLDSMGAGIDPTPILDPLRRQP